MSKWRRSLGVAGILFVATIESASAQKATSALSSSQASTQAEKPSAGTQVKAWIRSKLDAAKKRWAQNELKFQKKLGEKQEAKRLSLHDRGHFLERCMSQKP